MDHKPDLPSEKVSIVVFLSLIFVNKRVDRQELKLKVDVSLLSSMTTELTDLQEFGLAIWMFLD